MINFQTSTTKNKFIWKHKGNVKQQISLTKKKQICVHTKKKYCNRITSGKCQIEKIVINLPFTYMWVYSSPHSNWLNRRKKKRKNVERNANSGKQQTNFLLHFNMLHSIKYIYNNKHQLKIHKRDTFFDVKLIAAVFCHH